MAGGQPAAGRFACPCWVKWIVYFDYKNMANVCTFDVSLRVCVCVRRCAYVCMCVAQTHALVGSGGGGSERENERS